MIPTTADDWARSWSTKTKKNQLGTVDAVVDGARLELLERQRLALAQLAVLVAVTDLVAAVDGTVLAGRRQFDPRLREAVHRRRLSERTPCQHSTGKKMRKNRSQQRPTPLNPLKIKYQSNTVHENQIEDTQIKNLMKPRKIDKKKSCITYRNQ